MMFSVALTDGHNIFTDGSQRPELRASGVVTYNDNGKWTKCGDWSNDINASAVYDICQYLSFNDYLSYKVISIDGNDINVVSRMPVASPSSSQTQCKVLYINCQNDIDIDLKNRDADSISSEHVPWNANVYVNGLFRCRGMILNDTWIITSSGCFRDGNLR